MVTIWPNRSWLPLCVLIFPILYAYSVSSWHLAAAEQNKQLDFSGLRVYAIWAQFLSYSYDPSTEKFYPVEEIINEDWGIFWYDRWSVQFSKKLVQTTYSELTSFSSVSNKLLYGWPTGRSKDRAEKMVLVLQYIT